MTNRWWIYVANLVVLPEKPDAYAAAMSYYVKKIMDRTMNGQFSVDELNEKKERIRSSGSISGRTRDWSIRSGRLSNVPQMSLS